jgi:gliding motility-associated-like protein
MNIRAVLFGIIFLIFTQICNAQTCSGGFGPAVFTQNFGSGSTVIGPALSASSTSSYTYSGATAPNDGQYTIASSTAGMYSTWWTTPDHTGNQGGYMMIVNSKYDPTDAGGAVFYTENASLCMNTTYQFNVYLKNLNTVSSLKPNITITITTTGGTLLKTLTTGDISEDANAAWGTPVTFLFATPANENTVIIKMENINKGGTGNDFAMDDITIKPCGPIMVAGFGAGVTPTYSNCTANPQQDTLSVQVTPAPYTNPQYQWQINTGSGWTNIAGATSTAPYIFPQPASLGNYQYRLASAEGSNINTSSCLIYSNVISLTVTQSPAATATSNGPTVCEGSALMLSGGGGAFYTWTDPNGVQFSTSQNPVINNITPAQAGKYTVTAHLSGSPCTTQASVTITVQPKITAKVSNDTTICKGSSAQLRASGGISYKWAPSTGLSNDAAQNPVASPATTTTYTVTATNNSCSSTASVTVNVTQDPVISAGGNKTVITGQSVRLTGTAQGSGPISYVWTPALYLDDATSLTPLVTLPAGITNKTYTLQVTSPCTTVTDTAMVTVFLKVMVPNAFSPNNDMVNDKWEIPGLGAYPESLLCVYTRNGQMVFTTTGNSKVWDGNYNGQALPEGVYYYTIDLKNGSPTLSGYVTILR